MKPHPRIRKTVKWGGLAVTALLTVTWIGSRWWNLEYVTPTNKCWDVWAGALLFSVPRPGAYMYPPGPKLIGVPQEIRRYYWLPEIQDDRYWWSITLPLWVFAVPTLFAVAIGWKCENAARRRVRTGLCRSCNYDRTGLPEGAVCPECGSKPL